MNIKSIEKNIKELNDILKEKIKYRTLKFIYARVNTLCLTNFNKIKEGE